MYRLHFVILKGIEVKVLKVRFFTHLEHEVMHDKIIYYHCRRFVAVDCAILFSRKKSIAKNSRNDALSMHMNVKELQKAKNQQGYFTYICHRTNLETTKVPVSPLSLFTQLFDHEAKLTVLKV